jgi:hypothetical protein
MIIEKVVSRAGLRQLLILLDFDDLKVKEKELGYSEPRTLRFLFSVGENQPTNKRQDCCVRLLSLKNTTELPFGKKDFDDHFGADAFLAQLEVADIIEVKNLGLGPQWKEHPVPERILQTINTIG